MNIAADILKTIRTKVDRARAAGKVDDFYFDEADREALKALVAIVNDKAPLPQAVLNIAKQYNLM